MKNNYHKKRFQFQIFRKKRKDQTNNNKIKIKEIVP